MLCFQGIIQIRFETGLENILGLASNHTFTMAETTAYFEAYRHVLEGLQEMKDALPMARYLVECNPTIKPPQYLLSARGTGQMDLSSLLREDSRWDASAVTIINPQRWPPREETTLNESQVGLIRDGVVGNCLCYNLMSTRAIKSVLTIHITSMHYDKAYPSSVHVASSHECPHALKNAHIC